MPWVQRPGTGTSRLVVTGLKIRIMAKYDDIIDMPHHVSRKHPQMSMYQRAAQFAPFAALTGHEQAIEETARRNEEKYNF